MIQFKNIISLLRNWLNDLLHRASIRVCFLLETCLLLVLFIGVTKSATQIDTIDFFGYRFPSMYLRDLKAVGVLLMIIFEQSKLWILYIGIIGMAGFIAANQESPQIELLLIRPQSRSKLLLTQYLAMVVTFVFCIVYLCAGIWIVIGLKVDIWYTGFLSGSLLLCIAYGLSIPFLLWLIIWSRSKIFALMIFYVFCFISTGLEFRAQVFYPYWNNHIYHTIIDCFYYILPQLDGMLGDAANMLRYPDWRQAFHHLSLSHWVWSCIISTGYLGTAVYIFRKNDY